MFHDLEYRYRRAHFSQRGGNMKKLLLAVSLLLLVPAAFAQLQPNQFGVTISPHFAQQGFDWMNPAAVGHPLITSSTMMADVITSQFTVRNYAAKPVQSIEYGWRISAPTACGDSTLPVRWETATAKVNIAPGAEASIIPPEALSRPGSSNELSAEAFGTKTPVVLVMLGIVEVTFADGSTWSDDEAIERNTFDSSSYEKEEDCHSPTVERNAEQDKQKDPENPRRFVVEYWWRVAHPALFHL
jgi:hypothetical protein